MKQYKFKINGNEYAVDIVSVEDNLATVSVNGANFEVELEGEAVVTTKTPKVVRPVIQSVDTPVVQISERTPAGAAGDIKSPLPGVILSLDVKVGDKIKAGQRLLVLEAMKMENNIDSDKEGTVTAVKVAKGNSVLEGDVLITIG